MAQPRKNCGPLRSRTPNSPRCGTRAGGADQRTGSRRVVADSAASLRGPHWGDCGPCSAVLEERLPDEARLAGLRSRVTQLRLQPGAAGRRAGARGRGPGRPAHRVGGPAPPAASARGTRRRGPVAHEGGRRSRGTRGPGRALRRWPRRRAPPLRNTTAAPATEHQDRRQRWLDLREERLANAAAELASQLQAGVPCAVCGSPEHPAPAPAAASALAVAEAEKAAQQACEAAESRPRGAGT